MQEVDREKYFSLFEKFKDEMKDVKLARLNDRILIVDLLNLFIRSFAASPAMNGNGEHVGGLTGSLYSIGNAIRLTNATRCIVVADGENGSARRRKLFPDYKMKKKMHYNLNRAYDFRTKEEEERAMKLQLARFVDYLRCLPIQFVTVTGVEADDAIAYIAKDIFTEPNQKVTIMSSDRDFLQLVNDRISVWSPTKKKMYTPKDVLEEYSVSPNNFLFYKMLMGDASDNIPGIDGCGKVTIPKYLKLLTEDVAHSVSEVMKFAEDANSGKKKKKFYSNIIEATDKLLLNEQLMQLSDPYIVDHSKLEIATKVRCHIPTLNKYEIQLMYIKDSISNAIPNLDAWLLSTFSTLNALAMNAEKTGDK